MIDGVVLHGRAALRPDVHGDHRQGAGVPPRRARLGGQGQVDRRATSACSTATTSRARASARARGRRATRATRRFTGKLVTPITSNNNNFVKGAAGEPVLISLDDAQTLFHEFGHALHGLLSEVNYPGLRQHAARLRRVPVAGARDVGADAAGARPVRAALQDRQADAAGAGRQGRRVEEVQPGLRDGRVPVVGDRRHGAAHRCPTASIDADAFERDTLARIGAPREVAMRHRLPQFNHLFTSDSYSAGYYSYLWSEVMDADTREAFAEAGDVFDKATADEAAQVHPGARQLHRSHRGLPPVPRPRSRRQGAAQEARLPGRAVTKLIQTIRRDLD